MASALTQASRLSNERAAPRRGTGMEREGTETPNLSNDDSRCIVEILRQDSIELELEAQFERMQLEEVLAASMLDCVSSKSELAISTTADTATATTVRTSQSSSNSNDNQASSSSRLDKSLPQSERIDDKSKDADFAQSLLESEVAAFSLDRELALKLAREDGQVVDFTSLETSLAGSDPKGSDPKVDKKGKARDTSY